jgi:uncharacterized protein
MSRIKSIGMAEARPKLTQLVDEVSGGGEPYLIISGSRVKAVLIGLDQYNDMVERLEDVSNSAELIHLSDHKPAMLAERHPSDKDPLDLVNRRFKVPKQRLAAFCRRHHITKLALFGSVLRPDFRPDSDVDVLVEFEPGHVPGFAISDIESELSRLVGRKVDLRTLNDLSRYFRDSVVREARVEYAAAEP